MSLRLRQVAQINPPTPAFDRLPSDSELTFLPLEAVWPGERLDLSRRRLKEQVSTGYTRLQEGDILVPKITPTFQADRTVIAVGLEAGVGAGTTELHIVRVGAQCDRRYIRYLLSSKPFLDEGEASMIGVAGQKRVPDSCIRDLTVPIADLNVQRAIADYLDAETVRIDALIEKKREMIELFDESRQALVAKAVTTGLVETTRLVETNNTFAPLLAEGWQIRRLKTVVTRIVDTAHATAPAVDDGEYLVVRTANVKKGQLTLNDAIYTDRSAWREWTKRGVPLPGDVLFTREAPAGEACEVPKDVRLCLGQRMVLLVVDRGTTSGAWIVNSIYGGPAQAFIALLSRSTTVAHLNMNEIGNIPVVIPDLDTQQHTLEELAGKVTPIEKAHSVLQRQIDLLVEHRQALITAAVTGELEVPGVKA